MKKDDSKIKVAVQMFNFIAGGDWISIKNQQEADALIAGLADAGFDGLEWCNFQLGADYLDLDALKNKMDECGLKTCAMHFHYNSADTLEQDCRTAVQRCQTLGTDKLIFAYSVPDIFGIAPDADGKYTPEQIDEWALKADEVIDTLTEAAKGTGISILYHNHDAEMLTGTDGKPFMEMIHPDAIEFDVYWVAKGLDGKVSSALEYVRKNKDKTVLLHIKDGLDGSVFKGEMCGWGKGTYPLQSIVDCAKELGLEWVVIENDAPNNFGTTGLTDAQESAQYASKNIIF